MKKQYEVADKAWQPVVGCDPHMPCAPRCWARRTVSRIVECQAGTSPDRAAFYQISLSRNLATWSGSVYLDRKHLNDPYRWKDPATVATGFHGDWARLGRQDQEQMLAVMNSCARHTFMPLTKQPHLLLPMLRMMPGACENVTIGCSVMNQTEADRTREAMQEISRFGWRTHVWYEPAIGPVDWSGWEHIEQLIMGGESGVGARRCDLRWIAASLAWCKSNSVAPFVKQAGSDAWEYSEKHGILRPLKRSDRKGSDPAEWPEWMRVREYPEVQR